MVMMEPTVELIDAETVSGDELVDLYTSVGWTAYTREPDRLLDSLRHSRRVAVARDGAVLVGLARTLSDGAVITYLQDVLVRPDYQRLGLGRQLVRTVLGADPQVRQQVLLTDADPAMAAFYTSLGFTETHDHEPALRAFVRLG